MSNPAESQTKHRFLQLAAAGAVVGPIAATVLPRLALAADLPHLDPNDATAKALHYTNDAATAAGNPAFKAGADCANCTFYQGKPGEEWGPCMLFPGKSVHKNGWCASHNLKT